MPTTPTLQDDLKRMPICCRPPAYMSLVVGLRTKQFYGNHGARVRQLGYIPTSPSLPMIRLDKGTTKHSWEPVFRQVKCVVEHYFP